MGRLATMDPELKAAWLADLRSGEYKQGHGELCRAEGNGKYWCCIGVLADNIDSDRWTKSHDVGDDVDGSFSWGRRDDDGRATITCTLPRAEWHRILTLNLAKADDGLLISDIEHRLWEMNDEEMQSFDDIAAWVDENL